MHLSCMHKKFMFIGKRDVMLFVKTRKNFVVNLYKKKYMVDSMK